MKVGLLQRTNIEYALSKVRELSIKDSQYQINQIIKDLGIKRLNNFDLDLLNKQKIFHLDHIKKICIDYRLRFLDIKYFKNDLPNDAIKEIDKNLISNRAGRISSDDLLKTKEAYRNKNIIEAADESRGTLYNQSAKEVDSMITAVMSQPIVKSRQLKDLGITYKKNTGELIINDPAQASKDPLGRILVDLRNKQRDLKKQRQAEEEAQTGSPSRRWRGWCRWRWQRPPDLQQVAGSDSHEVP